MSPEQLREVNCNEEKREELLRFYAKNGIPLLRPFADWEREIVYSPALDRFFPLKLVLEMAGDLKTAGNQNENDWIEFELYGSRCWTKWNRQAVERPKKAAISVKGPDPAEILKDYLFTKTDYVARHLNLWEPTEMRTVWEYFKYTLLSVFGSRWNSKSATELAALPFFGLITGIDGLIVGLSVLLCLPIPELMPHQLNEKVEKFNCLIEVEELVNDSTPLLEGGKMNWEKLKELAELYLNSEHGELKEGAFVLFYGREGHFSQELTAVPVVVREMDGNRWKVDSTGTSGTVRKRGRVYELFLEDGKKLTTPFYKLP